MTIKHFLKIFPACTNLLDDCSVDEIEPQHFHVLCGLEKSTIVIVSEDFQWEFIPCGIIVKIEALQEEWEITTSNNQTHVGSIKILVNEYTFTI